MSDPVFSFGGGSRASAGDARPVLLLVDDEPLVGRFIAHAAEECGYQAIATTGIEGFRRAFRSEHPDAVAVDLGLPGADGIEILRFLAMEKCSAPVIIVSGHDRRVLESSVRYGEALGLNMAGHLTKPMRVAALAALLATLAPETAA